MIERQDKFGITDNVSWIDYIFVRCLLFISLYRVTIFRMNVLREFLLGFIKIHVLYHAQEEAFCGVEMMEELKRHGYVVGPGTLYPILHKLQSGGYLSPEKRVERGKMRIYYKATKKGMAVLEQTRPKIDELISEVMK